MNLLYMITYYYILIEFNLGQNNLKSFQENKLLIFV